MARQARSLVGKVVVITGGARGIGAATASAVARLGASVAIGDLDLDLAKGTADEIDGDTLALPLDVTDHARFTQFLDEVEKQLGPIDVLVNNAGIMRLGPFEDEDDRSTAQQLAINLHAVIHGTREAVKRMRPRGTGHIVNIASAAGKAGFPGGATYCATKHGVVGLSEAVRVELRGSGVEMSVVMPAVVRTELAVGLTESRFIKPVEPSEVADAIVAALRYPRFEVFVPRSLDATFRITRMLPRRAAEWVARTFKSDQVLFGASPEAREEYEARAAASAPGAERESTG
ncbi:SDR family oxidoreductase [Actinophytocola oryzae]|uniref:Short-subunit dehydrogenase n=1 Tax=Actinophytocola oryzae TaxID=502181 RepID=A0A4R7UY14_9PSEU|nr:SDR family oxidoreductase [Actinophytocola oryzae]TDV41749.1 short-subunit dehydrogenase [Actinophytocola oryzae]